MSLPRVSVRLYPQQMQVLQELSNVLNANVSTIVRAVIGDWLKKNDEVLERIITGEQPFNKDWRFDDE